MEYPMKLDGKIIGDAIAKGFKDITDSVIKKLDESSDTGKDKGKEKEGEDSKKNHTVNINVDTETLAKSIAKNLKPEDDDDDADDKMEDNGTDDYAFMDEKEIKAECVAKNIKVRAKHTVKDLVKKLRDFDVQAIAKAAADKLAAGDKCPECNATMKMMDSKVTCPKCG